MKRPMKHRPRRKIIYRLTQTTTNQKKIRVLKSKDSNEWTPPRQPLAMDQEPRLEWIVVERWVPEPPGARAVVPHQPSRPWPIAVRGLVPEPPRTFAMVVRQPAKCQALEQQQVAFWPFVAAPSTEETSRIVGGPQIDWLIDILENKLRSLVIEGAIQWPVVMQDSEGCLVVREPTFTERLDIFRGRQEAASRGHVYGGQPLWL
ncbi:uncharacterized protein LOC142986771 [Anticarsia gemmatalis]|uniref:uncharacterized protein LOC142986771 n=1 Tax=Anticarsia gemmatalis TaxID=129554 RepID=UPI003F776699